MNRLEAARYAHQLVADAIERAGCHVVGPDSEKVADAVRHIVEQHRRFGPKTTDRRPRLPEYRGEPIPFEAEHAEAPPT